ncbi:hypothetical protein P3T36_006372 [Kitasatospora sp. MAP12-15]|uniref:hypothetical protein n=1 Tax=unclassified Kitasatospora TaxID=2633591 RepID=UPI002474BF41|nr:hypothetical protein [Kitasatospora sp. MAP12-44]MDH6107913.1 hypothetical protein [Kitasatospora sp. MAP12-44]
MSDEYEIDGWDDDDATEAAVKSLVSTSQRADEERRTTSDQQMAEQIKAAVAAARPGLDKIPDPVEPSGDGDLTPDEEQRLAACVEGVELLSTAYWVAGKSLDTMAVGRLFRRLPHKLDPTRCYATIEEWADVEHGIKQSRASKLRAGWELGEVLNACGYKVPEGQVRELVPLKNRHGLKTAVGVYQLVVNAVGADKVTAERIRETVRLLPGDLALSDEDDPQVIAHTLNGAIEGAEPPQPKPSTALPAELKRDVDRRAVALADRLNRKRIDRQEVLGHLLAAFADDEDSRVFDAVFDRMKKAS